MLRVQGTGISTALRRALLLDAQGGYPLEAADTIVPVAIVADVRDAIDVEPVWVDGYRSVAVVAGQFPRAAVAVPQSAPLREVHVHKLSCFSTTTQNIFLGFSGLLISPTFDAVPQRHRYSQRAAAPFTQMIGDNSVAGAVLANYSKRIFLPANTSVDVDLGEAGVVLDNFSTAGCQYIVHGTVLGSDLHISARWQEFALV